MLPAPILAPRQCHVNFISRLSQIARSAIAADGVAAAESREIFRNSSFKAAGQATADPVRQLPRRLARRRPR